MAKPFQTQLLYQSVERGSLGEVWQSAISRNGLFPGGDAMRVFRDYALVYTIEGQCTYVHEDQTAQQFGPGDMFFVFPGIPHFYGPAPGHDWVQCFITFNGPVFDAWRQAGILDPKRFSLHLEPVDYWVGRLRSVIQDKAQARRKSLVRLCAFQEMLAEAITNDGRSKISEEEDFWLARAQNLLSHVPRADRLDLKKVADQMYMSYANFRRKFTQLANMPPARFHAGAMMQRACELMHGQRLTNRELADRLGYCNEFHFSQRFLQIVGVTPKQYRQSLPKHG